MEAKVYLKKGKPIDYSRDLVNFDRVKAQSRWVTNNDQIQSDNAQCDFTVLPPVGIFWGRFANQNRVVFAAARHSLQANKLREKSKVKLRVKGDGRDYQLRFSMNHHLDGVNYSAFFDTTVSRWQLLEFHEIDFIAVYRGKIVSRAPKFVLSNACHVELLTNAKLDGEFRLEIDQLRVF